MPQLIELKDAARALGLTAVVPEINGSEDVGGAIQALANERVDVIIVLESTMLLSLHRQIAQLMAANRRRVFYGYRDHVDEGGLIGYGVDLRWCWRRAATYVHRILNGAASADLPVELPAKIPMVVNLKAAEELGLMLSPTLLSRADEVIEWEQRPLGGTNAKYHDVRYTAAIGG